MTYGSLLYPGGTWSFFDPDSTSISVTPSPASSCGVSLMAISLEPNDLLPAVYIYCL